MYIGKQYGSIYLAIFSDTISTSDAETFGNEIQTLAELEEEIYLITLPVNVSSFPTGINSILQSLSAFKSATGRVSRVYGLRYSPIMTFIANITTQILKIKTNTVEAKDIEELFEILEKEATLYPKLQASVKYIPEIKEQISALSKLVG
jgi:hypothetical protein